MIRQLSILAAASALLAGSAAEAAAQFTGVVTPPPPARSAQAVAARADSVARSVGARDSANATRLTNMKTWVDSATVALAGGNAQMSAAVSDTGMPADTTARGGVAAGRRRGGGGGAAAAAEPEPTMREGARAPDTATPLPTIAVLGVFGLGAGLVLMGRRRRA